MNVSILSQTVTASALFTIIAGCHRPQPAVVARQDAAPVYLDDSAILSTEPVSSEPLPAFLARCPTPADRSTFHRDFTIHFGEEILRDEAQDPYDCRDGEARSTPRLSLYNGLRVARHIHFDRPLPLIGRNNLYDWLSSLRIGIQVFRGDGNSRSHQGVIYINEAALVNHSCYDERGMVSVLGLILHEARHTPTGGGFLHTCGDGDDLILEEGGSWALVYHYYDWLANHSGEYLTDDLRRYAGDQADEIFRSRFCYSISSHPR